MRFANVELGKIASHHQAHHLIVADLVARQFAGVLAVAQHCDAVGDFLHFAEPVRDINDRGAPRLQVSDDPEEHLDLGGAQG